MVSEIKYIIAVINSNLSIQNLKDVNLQTKDNGFSSWENANEECKQKGNGKMSTATF